MEKRGSSRDAAPGRDASFGARLRRLREAAGLTQEELAARAGLSAHAIGVLERGERKRPHPHTIRSLADALGLSDDERASLLASVPKRDGPRAAPVAAAEPTLPVPPTPLVGRERELEEVRTFLREVRLLTLTGTGGVGKTRLALEAARDATDRFPDGVTFVALAPLGDSALVAPAVARSLRLRETEGQTPREVLRIYLRGKRLLLVLDNFEHLLEAAPEVAELIEACPGLVVLATSRAPLRLRGEQEYPVGSLALPASTCSSVAEEVVGSPSGRLFVERARAVSPAFELTAHNIAAVAAICWRLAGLLLALELAAAGVRFLDPTALLARLDGALSAGWARDLPERQRTMSATLDWSHDLLSEGGKVLFRRLSVFAGGFPLEAAEAVGGDDPGRLGGLVEQSLVTVVEDAASEGESRYGMLEPVRQYALEKLRESGEEERVRGRHAAYFLRLAEEAAPELRGPGQVEALARLDAEHDNLRAAITWALSEGRTETAVRLCWALFMFWWVRGLYSEGRRFIEGALGRDAGLSPSMRGKALFVAGMMRSVAGDHARGTALGEEAVTLSRTSGDKSTLAVVLASLGFAAARGRRDYGGATVLLEESLSLYRELGDDWGSALVLSNLARTTTLRGDLVGRAASLLEEGLKLARELGDRNAVAEALHNSAVAALVSGEHERAASLLGEALALAAEVGHRSVIADCLEALACIASLRRDPRRSARLWASAEALREAAGVPAAGPERPLYEGHLAAARAALEGETFEAEWAEGQAMTLEEAIAGALAESA